MGSADFLTPERYEAEQRSRMESSEGKLLVVSCRSGSFLADQAVESYRRLLRENGSEGELTFLSDVDQRFSDSETLVRFDHFVNGHDAYLFQGLFDPRTSRSVDENLMAFLIAARALREHGANFITAILPYLAYSRQDKPTNLSREPVTARLIADLSATAGIDRVVTWHPHAPQIRGFYAPMPSSMLDPVRLFREEFSEFAGDDQCIAVAPDVGATELTTDFAEQMGIRSAIAHKVRPAPEELEIADLIGDFRGRRRAIILDDIVSSSGTLTKVARKLVAETRIEEVYVGVSHNLCTDSALENIRALYEEGILKRFVATDTIPQTKDFLELPCFSVHSLAEVFARVINRLHYNRSVSEIFRGKR